MNLYQKLTEARIRLADMNLKKSGHNKFAGYYYYELGDFIPTTMRIFRDLNLCGFITYSADEATLTIADAEKVSPQDPVLLFKSPMSTAQLKRCHEVQNLGAVETYIRRYLWTIALELVEHDAIDASEPDGVKPKKTEPEPKPEPKKELGPIATAKELDNTKPKKVEQKVWQISQLDPSTSEFAGPFVEALKFTLTQATTVENVQEIFRVNRSLFDSLKEKDKPLYEEAMDALKSRKNDLTKE